MGSQRIEICFDGGFSIGRRKLGHRRPPHKLEIRHPAQLTTSQSPDPGSSPTLLTIPPSIRAIRDQVFNITEEITEQFDEYWGYMDSFWV